MGKTIRALLIAAGIGGIGYGLYRFYDAQVKFLKNIQYNIEFIKVLQLSAELVSLEITLRVYNYSNIEATVKELYLDFFVNDVLVGNIQEAKDMLILPGKYTDVSFTFNFNPQKAFKNILNIISIATSLKDVKFVATGFVKIKSSFITKTLPYSYETTFKEFIK